MKSPKAWLAGKLSEPCACASGRDYRECCYRRERAYFVIGVAVALALFGGHKLTWLPLLVPFLLIAAFATKRRFDRERRRSQKHENGPA